VDPDGNKAIAPNDVISNFHEFEPLKIKGDPTLEDEPISVEQYSNLTNVTTVVQDDTSPSNNLGPQVSQLRRAFNWFTKTATSLAQGASDWFTKIAVPLQNASNRLKEIATSIYDKTIGGIVSDIRNFNWSNENERVVLESKLFSAYKGQLVIRAPFVSRSMSLGIMFLQKNGADVDMVKHERGHLDQMRELGTLKYLVGIGIPSATSKVEGPEYYDQPWEIGADRSGGIDREYSLGAVVAGETYMEWLKENNLRAIFKGILRIRKGLSYNGTE
jgi:hypothetical protein